MSTVNVLETPVYQNLVDVARRVGLTAELTERNGLYGITVQRQGADWSMAPTQIAIARSLDEVSRKATDAIKALAPQIAKKVAAAQPDEPDGVLIAGGVGADGTVTALRVERDGTVRLHPDDIEAIAERVAEKLGAGSPLVVPVTRVATNAIAAGPGPSGRGVS